MNKENIVISCISIIDLFGYFIMSLSFLTIQEIDGRCHYGYIKSPGRDCEKVTDTKGMPRCPNGYHISLEGYCEKVSKVSNERSIDNNKDDNGYENNKGVIYLITGTGGRSLYEIKEQAPFVAKQDDKHFGFLNIDINGKKLKGTFYANELQIPRYYYVKYQNNVIDDLQFQKQMN
jgi:hypothetical protein